MRPQKPLPTFKCEECGREVDVLKGRFLHQTEDGDLCNDCFVSFFELAVKGWEDE